MVLSVGLALASLVWAQDHHRRINDQISQSRKAATVFREVMNTPA